MKSNASGTTQHVTLAIEGMSCGGCVQAVKSLLARVSSTRVRSVAVGSAEIEALTPGAAQDAVAALAEAGYPARVAPQAVPSTRPSAGGCCGGPSGCCG